MSNFLQFIEEDIQSKKTLISTMPIKTKSNIKKFNEKIDAIDEKYQEYASSIKKYLEVKSKSFHIESTKETSEQEKNVAHLEHVRFILNPSNTYYEKMGFDTLFYHLDNYQDFKFDILNEIINDFLDKFESVGIMLQKDEFDYTHYVNEFMSAFLEVRSLKSNNYLAVSEIFEKIYWVNPEIIEHVELNLKKLIKKYEKKFMEHIAKMQQEIRLTNMTYELCLDKLKLAYEEFEKANTETISDIIELTKEGQIDINNYFEDSKNRSAAFSNLMIDPINWGDNDAMERFYEDLEKLRHNIEEYKNFVKFIPLFEDFKKEYVKSSEKEINPKDLGKNVKALESQINSNEVKLDKLNRKISGVKTKLFGFDENDIKKNRFEAVKIANELHDLYKNRDQEFFKDKVQSVFNSTFTISDLLHLYYSFDYFKKTAIKRVFEINNFEELVNFSDSFDSFATNPTNVIINGIALYEDVNIARIIVNKYRLANINITEEDLNPDDLDTLLNNINLVLRVNIIEKSETSIEKIWFMAQVANLI